MTTPNPHQRRFKRAVVVLAIFVISGTGYEQIGRYRDRHRHDQIGKSVEIGGRTLNIFCSGNGGPAVVFVSTVSYPTTRTAIMQ